MAGLELFISGINRKRNRLNENHMKDIGPTDKYVQHIGKLNRKQCRMSMELLIGHIYLQCVLHKRTAKSSSYRKNDVSSV